VSDLSSLLSSVGNFLYEPASILCRQSAPATSLFSLREGVVKVELLDKNGNLTILRLLGPGAVIGLETIIDQGEPYHSTVTALTEVDACRIPMQVAHRLMKDHPEHYKVVVKLSQQHLDAADEAMVYFRQGELRERLTHVMKTLTSYTRDGLSFELPAGKDLGALTGATPEAVSRVMASYKRHGVIEHLENNRYRLKG
jgi:CRP-like cAMP-binding protein